MTITAAEAAAYSGISTPNYNTVAAADDGFIRSVTVQRRNPDFQYHDAYSTDTSRFFSVATNGTVMVRAHVDSGGTLRNEYMNVENNDPAITNTWTTAGITLGGLAPQRVSTIYNTNDGKFWITYVDAAYKVQHYKSTTGNGGWVLSNFWTTAISITGDFLYAFTASNTIGSFVSFYWWVYDGPSVSQELWSMDANSTTAQTRNFISVGESPTSLDCIDYADSSDDAAIAVAGSQLRHFVAFTCKGPSLFSYQDNGGSLTRIRKDTGGIYGFVIRPALLATGRVVPHPAWPTVDVQTFDNLTAIQTRTFVHLSSINGTMFLTAGGGDGDYNGTDATFSYTADYYYTSKNGFHWSQERIVPISDLTGYADLNNTGVQLCKMGNYVYLVGNKHTLRSLASSEFGTAHPNWTLDLSQRITEYSSEDGDVRQSSFTLDNRDDYFGTSILAQNCEMTIFTKFGQRFAGVDYLQQVAIEEIDSVTFGRERPHETVSVTARERLSWLADRTQNGYAIQYDNQISGADNFADIGSVVNSGLAHTATILGTLVTQSNKLIAATSYTETIGFNTFDINMTDCSIQCDFVVMVPASHGGGVHPGYGGVIWHAFDKDNFWYCKWDVATALLHIGYRSTGTDTDVTTFLPSTYFGTQGGAEGVIRMRVEVRGNIAYIHTFDNTGAGVFVQHAAVTMRASGGGFDALAQGYVGVVMNSFSDQTTYAAAGYAQNLFMSNGNGSVTLEDVFKRYAAFGGIHDFEFVNSFPTFDPAHWTALGSGGSYSGGSILQSGTSGADQVAWYDTDMPHSYTVEFWLRKIKFSFFVRGDGVNNYYEIQYDGNTSATGFVTIWKVVGGSGTAVYNRALQSWEVANAGSKLKISVRDSQLASDSANRILYISVWMDDLNIASYADLSAGAPPLRMGFKIVSGTTAGTVLTDFKVPNLGEIIPWSSLDPGERPLDAINRAIEDRYIKYWIRWNGNLKAWSPGQRSAAVTLTTAKEFSNVPATDLRQIYSHIRVVGAFQWVQLIDNTLLRSVGHRFAEINNTSLWNADDCVRVGQQMFIWAKEQMFQVSFATLGQIFLEHEDRVQIPDVHAPGAYKDYIVDSIQWEYSNGAIVAHIGGRQYFYG